MAWVSGAAGALTLQRARWIDNVAGVEPCRTPIVVQLSKPNIVELRLRLRGGKRCSIDPMRRRSIISRSEVVIANCAYDRQDGRWIEIERIGESQELDNVDTAFPPLNIGNVRLRPLQPACDLGL